MQIPVPPRTDDPKELKNFLILLVNYIKTLPTTTSGGGGGTTGGGGSSIPDSDIMRKSVYDADRDGVSDNSKKLDGSTKTEVQTHAPQAHASSHQSGGGDAVKLDDLAAPDANTDLNVSTSKHGLCPVLPNDDTKFLDGKGNYTAPAAGGIAAATVGDYVEGRAPLEQSTISTAYVKLLEIKLGRAGNFRVKFDLHSTAGETAYGKIYKNGAAVGVEKSTTSVTYVTESDDVNGWAAGDLLQLYVKNSIGNFSYAANLKVCIATPILAAPYYTEI